MYDPIKPKEKKSGVKPYGFHACEYDERSGRGVDAGESYGVGFRNPVGHAGGAKPSASTLPFGRVDTLNIYEKK